MKVAGEKEEEVNVWEGRELKRVYKRSQDLKGVFLGFVADLFFQTRATSLFGYTLQEPSSFLLKVHHNGMYCCINSNLVKTFSRQALKGASRLMQKREAVKIIGTISQWRLSLPEPLYLKRKAWSSEKR